MGTRVRFLPGAESNSRDLDGSRRVSRCAAPFSISRTYTVKHTGVGRGRLTLLEKRKEREKLRGNAKGGVGDLRGWWGLVAE